MITIEHNYEAPKTNNRQDVTVYKALIGCTIYIKKDMYRMLFISFKFLLPLSCHVCVMLFPCHVIFVSCCFHCHVLFVSCCFHCHVMLCHVISFVMSCLCHVVSTVMYYLCHVVSTVMSCCFHCHVMFVSCCFHRHVIFVACYFLCQVDILYGSVAYCSVLDFNQ